MDKLTVNQVINIVDHMSDIIIENEVYFCELDSVAGDGDFGMSLAKGFKVLKNEWIDLPKEDVGGFLKECGMLITEYCGGASGPIWGSAFRGMGKYAAGKAEVSLNELAEMLQSAVDGIQKRGGAKLGDKTLLDALIPAVESLKVSAADSEDLLLAMKKSAAEAVAGAEKTKEIVATKGRASYVGERSINFPDAGATAIGIIFTKIVETIA
jgi:phosphoenolpyruvate---glycerone phosphotransferase subunit DhaL